MKRELKVDVTGGAVFNSSYRKAHPDEKGTERACVLVWSYVISKIARLIPMKRELKVHRSAFLRLALVRSQGSSR